MSPDSRIPVFSNPRRFDIAPSLGDPRSPRRWAIRDRPIMERSAPNQSAHKPRQDALLPFDEPRVLGARFSLVVRWIGPPWPQGRRATAFYAVTRRPDWLKPRFKSKFPRAQASRQTLAPNPRTQASRPSRAPKTLYSISCPDPVRPKSVLSHVYSAPCGRPPGDSDPGLCHRSRHRRIGFSVTQSRSSDGGHRGLVRHLPVFPGCRGNPRSTCTRGGGRGLAGRAW